MATKKSQYGVIEGTLVFAKVAQADNKYESKDKEFSIGVVVDEDAADAWEDTYKKQAAKKIKASEFEAKYKIPCPIKDAKNVYVITLRKDAVVDGEEMPFRPKVFLDTTEDGEDVRLDITESRLIANGSKGKVSFYISSNTYGTFARLNNVLLDDAGFIEYQSKGGGAGSEFGDGKKPTKKEGAKDSATKARPERNATEPKEETPTKPAKAKKAPANFVDDGEIPF